MNEYAFRVKKKLIDFSEIILGHPFRGAVEEDLDGNCFLVQTKNIYFSGRLDSDLVKINLATSRTKGIVEDGDILLSNRGNFKSAVYRGKQKNIVASASLYILRVDKDSVLPEYLSIYLNSKLGQKSLLECNRGAFIKSLPKAVLSILNIPLPNLKKQEKIIEVHNNHLEREMLYVRRAELQKNIAFATIHHLITS